MLLIFSLVCMIPVAVPAMPPIRLSSITAPTGFMPSTIKRGILLSLHTFKSDSSAEITVLSWGTKGNEENQCSYGQKSHYAVWRAGRRIFSRLALPEPAIYHAHRHDQGNVQNWKNSKHVWSVDEKGENILDKNKNKVDGDKTDRHGRE